MKASISLPDVQCERRQNDRELRRLRAKLEAGGRNVGATRAAYDRRRTRKVELADRERQLRAAAV